MKGLQEIRSSGVLNQVIISKRKGITNITIFKDQTKKFQYQQLNVIIDLWNLYFQKWEFKSQSTKRHN
jgi:hypothetical protein